MPYVSCPSCEQVTLTRPSRLDAELCTRCGTPLPFTRTVIPLSRYRALVDERPEHPELVLSPA
jgi:uncharacterized paraquat-inducible protein A